jgi:60 kDa SS-A/Ro ribonucleoprotein
MTSATQKYAKTVAPKTAKTPTHQTKAIPTREKEMVTNNASGKVFRTGPWIALNRFLVMGTEKNSYYVGAQQLTKDAAQNVLKALKEDGVRVVNEIVEISDSGRAAKNDSAIFALALALIYGDAQTKLAVEQNVGKVLRIGTHLFDFVAVIKQLGKWNGSTKRTINNWYQSKRGLEYNVLKYQQRNGWSHRDVLRLAHVKPSTEEQDALFHWVSSQGDLKKEINRELIPLVTVYEYLRDNATEANAIEAIKQFNFSHEMIPRDLLKSPKVWEAMLDGMGLTALIRNLGRLSSLGLSKPLSTTLKVICDRLRDENAIQKARIHPINVLNAMQQYKHGNGDKGDLSWVVSTNIQSALEDTFYKSFKYLEPTGKNFLIAIDCSGSMFGAKAQGLSNITAAEAAAVMAMAIARVEKNYHFVGFNTVCAPLAINASMNLNQVMEVIRRFSWGGTDCAQAAIYAEKNKLDVDAIIMFTDNETYFGRIHPTQALESYRKSRNKPNCVQVVCATSVTKFTISDPKDQLQLDVAGFDSAVPSIITELVSGQI